MQVMWEIPDFPSDGSTMKVEVGSFQWGSGRAIGSATGVAGSREASAPAITELVVTHKMDKFSAAIYQEVVSGSGRPMNFYFLKSVGKTVHTYVTYNLENATISGYNFSSSGDDSPMESISITFTKVSYKYEPAPKI